MSNLYVKFCANTDNRSLVGPPELLLPPIVLDDGFFLLESLDAAWIDKYELQSKFSKSASQCQKTQFSKYL